jgi:hypothetical protein
LDRKINGIARFFFSTSKNEISRQRLTEVYLWKAIFDVIYIDLDYSDNRWCSAMIFECTPALAAMRVAAQGPATPCRLTAVAAPWAKAEMAA